MEAAVIPKRGGQKRKYTTNYDSKENYKKINDIESLLTYILDPSARGQIDFYGRINLFAFEPKDIVAEMKMLLNCFEKGKGFKIRHFCFAIDGIDYEKISKKRFKKSIIKLLGYFRGYPVVYALHENTEHLHIHFLVLAASYIGKKLDLTDQYLEGFEKYFAKSMNEFYSNDSKAKIILYY